MEKTKIFLVFGPSGSGKNTIIRGVRNWRPDISVAVSCTTRSPRPDEVDGVHYHFWSEERFEEAVQKGLFLEWVEYSGHRYATMKTAIKPGRTTILEIDLNGVREVKKSLPEAITVMILPPTIVALEENLRGRHDTEERSIQRRLRQAVDEIIEGPAIADFIILNRNGELGLSRSVSMLRHILNTA